MLLRRSAQVAVRACVLLASDPESAPRPVRELACEMGVGASYVTKILRDLVRASLVDGVRGPKGGVKLARSAGELRLWDVLAAVQAMGKIDHCLLGQNACDDGRPCPLHEDWTPIRAQIIHLFQSKKISALAARSDAGTRDVLGEKP